MRFSEIYKSCQKTYNAFESLKSELRKAKKRLISNNYKKTMHKTPFFYFFLEAVLISFDKFVKHDLDECDLYHGFRSFSEEFIIDG